MTKQTTKSLSRKISLVLGALVVSTMSIAAASQANAGVKVYLGWGSWGGGPAIGGNICDFYWFKYKKTGKFKYKKKYMKCMGYW